MLIELSKQVAEYTSEQVRYHLACIGEFGTEHADFIEALLREAYSQGYDTGCYEDTHFPHYTDEFDK
jgi:hypothetical protein